MTNGRTEASLSEMEVFRGNSATKWSASQCFRRTDRISVGVVTDTSAVSSLSHIFEVPIHGGICIRDTSCEGRHHGATDTYEGPTVWQNIAFLLGDCDSCPVSDFGRFLCFMFLYAERAGQHIDACASIVLLFVDIFEFPRDTPMRWTSPRFELRKFIQWGTISLHSQTNYTKAKSVPRIFSKIKTSIQNLMHQGTCRLAYPRVYGGCFVCWRWHTWGGCTAKGGISARVHVRCGLSFRQGYSLFQWHDFWTRTRAHVRFWLIWNENSSIRPERYQTPFFDSKFESIARQDSPGIRFRRRTISYYVGCADQWVFRSEKQVQNDRKFFILNENLMSSSSSSSEKYRKFVALFKDTT